MVKIHIGTWNIYLYIFAVRSIIIIVIIIIIWIAMKHSLFVTISFLKIRHIFKRSYPVEHYFRHPLTNTKLVKKLNLS